MKRSLRGQGRRRRSGRQFLRHPAALASVTALGVAAAAVVATQSGAAPDRTRPCASARATPQPAGAARAKCRSTATPGAVESLNRAPVSVHTGDGNLVSWRSLSTDADDIAFDVYRDGTKITGSPVTGATNFLDAGSTADAEYTVRVQGKNSGEKALSLAAGYLDVPITAPEGGTVDGNEYTYSANDASVGDLDGDGDLDFVLKWQPSNAKDNSQNGYTGDTILDAYTVEGDRLWRIDLGPNIRSGAHYTQFQVWDYDGDGDAEVAVKTADGTVDGRGDAIGDAGADHRNEYGYVLTGPEYLTMFDGRTGASVTTADFAPERGDVSSWGDAYGNRVDRFLAATAFLDGTRSALIEARGYYNRTVVTAWEWDGGTFTRRWTFDTADDSGAGKEYEGQGNHNLAVADVDQDGKDEIVYGAMALDDDGTVLWNTGNGHGDALHVGDLVPDRPGLEVFKVDEDGDKPSSWMADARTGEILWSTPAAGDNGRGVSADIWAANPGAESWSAADAALRDTAGDAMGERPSSANFTVWWDGDSDRELLDRGKIDDWTPEGEKRLLTPQGVRTNNGTKATASMSGDILGDWREEVVWPTADSTALRIYSTPHLTELKATTLLADRQYREALAWQNTGYNQPPHPGFALADRAMGQD